MPARLSQKNLVARPDRADFRDRQYLPPLKSLPPLWPPRSIVDRNFADYAGNILDQGNEGACTGFGLAAVINFIYWSAWREDALRASAKDHPKDSRPQLVSAHMLYHNAKLYDEWEGDDYEGSSCRGAMKGWHKHGVCRDPLWSPNAKMQEPDWRTDAAKRPLGAYYRVDAKSIADMQSAIFEVRSIYCSADVHEGWTKPAGTTTVDGIKISRIKYAKLKAGGHAFALIGYTSEGFIVQNSWGKDWGTGGFALLTYEDWVKNGYDAWVAAVGAPMEVASPAAAGRTSLLNVAASGTASTNRGAITRNSVDPWSEEQAYRHSIIMGNDGKLMQRIVGASDAETALGIVLNEEVVNQGNSEIVIYVHGGLNDEQAAMARARRMGPWFMANGIHPLFVVWRTGLLESLGSIAQDEIKKYEEQIKNLRSKGLSDVISGAVRAAAEAKDRAFEVAAEKLIGKAVWSQIKQNAQMAAVAGGPLTKVLKILREHRNKRVHLLGHSAGSIMIGHLLDAAGRAATAMNFASCGLYAPACTLKFATEKFGTALTTGGPLAKAPLAIDVLTDEAEVSDSVGPYGKSLLYLVSRALEETHKTPLLGIDLAVRPDVKRKNAGMEFSQPELKKTIDDWQNAIAKLPRVTVKAHPGPRIKTSTIQTEKIAHGTFDNDIDVINASIARILGALPRRRVTDLTGF